MVNPSGSWDAVFLLDAYAVTIYNKCRFFASLGTTALA